MKFLATACVALCLAAPWARAEPSRSERVEAMLSEVSVWLNQGWSAQYPGEAFIAQPLPMSNASFSSFVRGRFRPEDQARAVSHALAAFYEPRGFVNGSPSAICYLLFNSDRLADLESQFYLFPDPESQMAATLFLVAHEAGHCLDRRFAEQSAPPASLSEPNDRARWGEYGADLFAGLAVLDVTGNQALMQKIAERRRQGGPTHGTEPGLRELLSQSKKNALPRGLFIKDLWSLADNLRKKTFQ